MMQLETTTQLELPLDHEPCQDHWAKRIADVEENCECGLTEGGLWDETLFDQWGCECNTGDCDDTF